MKILKIIILLFSFLLFVNCGNEVKKPKVSYTKDAKAKTKVDTTEIKIADLPINFEGTNYLIHPIGDLNNYEGASKYDSGSRSDYNQNFKVSNYNDFQITGYLKDLEFQEIGTDSVHSLSMKPMMIESATYLKSIADKSGQQLILYTLADTDSNNDMKLDENDIKSLYISTIAGLKFTKLSADFRELLDWNLIESKNLLYFRTIEDTNKNGKFDKNDTLHYHYLSLSAKDWKVLEYYPI
jgi:enoyl-[acyl-carrier-protein] reductase (NADH)